MLSLRRLQSTVTEAIHSEIFTKLSLLGCCSGVTEIKCLPLHYFFKRGYQLQGERSIYFVDHIGSIFPFNHRFARLEQQSMSHVLYIAAYICYTPASHVPSVGNQLTKVQIFVRNHCKGERPYSRNLHSNCQVHVRVLVHCTCAM